MNLTKIILTLLGIGLAIAGLAGIPVYALERDILRFALFTVMFAAGIMLLGHAAKS